MSHELSGEGPWPIDENIEWRFEGLIAKTRVDGLRVVDILSSWQKAKEVQL